MMNHISRNRRRRGSAGVIRTAIEACERRILMSAGLTGEYFNSTYAFDMHRVGDHGMPGSRRCLTVQEMRQRGMDKNATDWWISGSRLDSDLDYAL